MVSAFQKSFKISLLTVSQGSRSFYRWMCDDVFWTGAFVILSVFVSMFAIQKDVFKQVVAGVMLSSRLNKFLFPSLTRSFFIRVAVLTILSVLVFGYLLIPLRIQGHSMEPAYKDGSFAFCWRLHYLFHGPQRFDVVAVRFAGRGVMLLKRIVALPGETVAFENGVLLVNGTPLDEPYVHSTSDWDLPGRMVKPGHVYIVGDNRGTAMAGHRFGQVSIERIAGGVLP